MLSWLEGATCRLEPPLECQSILIKNAAHSYQSVIPLCAHEKVIAFFIRKAEKTLKFG